jgi:hypothetical protein
MMNALLALSDNDLDGELKKPDALRLYPSRNTSDADGIEIPWAPFDFVNQNARIVIVGVTPGPNQTRRSYKAVRMAVAKGENPHADVERIKAGSSFRGDVMEPNLKSLSWNIAAWPNARVSRTSTIFGPKRRRRCTSRRPSVTRPSSTVKCSTTRSTLSITRNSGSTWRAVSPRSLPLAAGATPRFSFERH